MSFRSLGSFASARLLAGVFVWCIALGSLGGLGGCALVIPQTEGLYAAKPADLPELVELKEVPFFPQDDYQCGPAALATVLANFKPGITPEQLVGQVYLPGRQGSLQVEMLAATRRHGMVAYPLAPRFDSVLREVAAGSPVIVLQDYGVWPVSVWHYAVVIGYDYPRMEAIMRSGENRRLIIPFGILEYTWKESDYWAMVALPPDKLPVTATETTYVASVIALERTGNSRAASIAYATALGRWPENIAATAGLANAHHALGELDKAEMVLRRGVEQHATSVILLNNLAQTLSDLGRHAEALSFIDRATALGGNLAEAVKETRELIVKRLSTPALLREPMTKQAPGLRKRQ